MTPFGNLIGLARDGQLERWFGHNCPFRPRVREVVRAENCSGRTTRVSRYPGRTPFSSGTVMPKASNKPRRPDAVTITARVCFILSVQPRSK